MHMVTLQELYDKIRDKVQDAPVYEVPSMTGGAMALEVHHMR